MIVFGITFVLFYLKLSGKDGFWYGDKLLLFSQDPFMQIMAYLNCKRTKLIEDETKQQQQRYLLAVYFKKTQNSFRALCLFTFCHL